MKGEKWMLAADGPGIDVGPATRSQRCEAVEHRRRCIKYSKMIAGMLDRVFEIVSSITCLPLLKSELPWLWSLLALWLDSMLVR